MFWCNLVITINLQINRIHLLLQQIWHVAQLVEQVAVNHLVGGSSPSMPDMISRIIEQ